MIYIMTAENPMLDGTLPTESKVVPLPYWNYEDVFFENEAAVWRDVWDQAGWRVRRHHINHFITSRRKNLMCYKNISKICSNEDGYDSLLVLRELQSCSRWNRMVTQNRCATFSPPRGSEPVASSPFLTLKTLKLYSLDSLIKRPCSSQFVKCTHIGIAFHCE